ncbi:hypothetical protein SAY87_007601 [Trapa incisa]|uniref:Uncharacterized protein n=1 Tax=Trapa incisa TaxID=236973 RepID=A0AAN7KIU8_9MYRT|nr:hypothetical protein SAY87_007601 [Trapa incisa]
MATSLGSMLTIVLSFIFSVLITVLLVQLICVKLRQRQFGRRSGSSRDREYFSSSTASTTTSTYFYPLTKELLYFFCWNNQSRSVDPPAVTAPDAPIGPPELEDISDILKWPGDFYVPPKFLFTISENCQEKEAIVREQKDISKVSTDGNVAASAPPEEVVMKKRASLRECLEVSQSIPAVETKTEVVDAATAAEEVLEDDVAVATPFSTPYTSPSYFTPWLSPAGDHHITIDTDNESPDSATRSNNEAPPFATIENGSEGVGLDSGKRAVCPP